MSPSCLCCLLLLALAVLGEEEDGQSRDGSHSVAQCAKPTAPGIESVSNQREPNRDYYNRGEEVTVTCAPGYQSVSQIIRCKKTEKNGTRSNWDVSLPCIAFQVNVRRVTPTSISLQWECQPGPCRSYWYMSVSCEAGGQIRGSSQIHTVTEGATVRGLEPHTEYIITISGLRRGKWTELERRTIRTEESAPGKPDFTQYPSINNNTLKWRLSETHGVLTGYQLNISAHREYDITFSETESHWLGPNVTEFNMELRNGTNYTVTLRGFTVSGPGEPAVWAHETSIGEPPEPINKWIGVANQAAFFLLHSVPSQHGPISSYEIIIAQGWNGSLRQLCTSYTSTLYNSSQVPTLYTAMLLPAENVTGSMNVTLGDGRHDGTFYNAPLRSDQNYTLYVRVTSTWKKVTKSSCTRFGPFRRKLKFTQFPINNNNNILRWRLSEIHGVVIGYQLNMVAWKEHTVIEEESQRLPPNVMEHRIPMEPGSSYMVTVRALTAAGPGEASLWLSGTPKATGASDSYVRVSLVLKPLFLTVLILILLCVTVKEKWEQRGAGDENQWIETERGGSEEMAPL
ncbi:receptor-type tyrosine-protein phosphatase mu-like isoform X1 [Xenopus tropicalis]|uniref:Receptor-type tyrosine-protein phosphatase mu-like isoform X1 n=2 Tax=Xenopus tropicalis TaxID=8364 RepID=A0A8J1IZ64_XENTR|nr:receptor-type tyrosine-protein phosphatase mu-like isoform X1 [Xenopus tropicalis]